MKQAPFAQTSCRAALALALALLTGCKCQHDAPIFAGQAVVDTYLAFPGFGIDAYEASRRDATATAAGQDNSLAVSRPGAIPWANVDWEEARQACERSGKRLCRLNEWLAACQGEAQRMFPYGGDFEPLRCNVRYTGEKVIKPTGSFANCKTEAGIYDLSGNVWEWVDDPDTIEKQPLKGGSYNTGAKMAYSVSCAYDQYHAERASKAEDIGFRCCRDP